MNYWESQDVADMRASLRSALYCAQQGKIASCEHYLSMAAQARMRAGWEQHREEYRGCVLECQAAIDELRMRGAA